MTRRGMVVANKEIREMHRLKLTAVIAMFALSACSAVAVPASSPPSAVVTATESPAPWPVGRLVYGRFAAAGQTPFTSNTDGTEERQLMPPPAWGPRWAPNGLQFAVAVGEPPRELLVSGTVKPDGTDFVRFVSPDSSLNLGCTVWSRDGSRLACEGWDDTDPTRTGIYTVRSTDGGGLTRITTSSDDQHDIPGDYTLDGGQIIFCRSGDEGHVMVVKLDGSDEHRVSDQPMCSGRLSPDGTTILTASGSYLTLVPVGGGQPTPIRIADAPNGSNFLGGAEGPGGGAWSPDGQWIVFSLHTTNALHSDIYIMRMDGTDLRQVTNTPDQNEEFADWAPAP